MFTLSDFDFNLPPELIAQTALAERSASRLLEVDNRTSPATLTDRRFSELPGLIDAGDLLVFNDTKVLKARFLGKKASGGRIEVLIERLTGATTALAQIRASKSPAPGTTLTLADAFDVTVGERVEPFFTLHFPADCLTLIERYGRLPLPPYIEHDPDAVDETRYQTVYAANPGAVAAPTAGLHFTPEILARVPHTFLTLHVGVGTFRPVQVDDLSEHRMHSERFRISEKSAAEINAAQRLVAIGTTTARVLESQGLPVSACESSTDIFIHPPYQPRAIGALLTNFHLPKSTLLMLVSALAGRDFVMRAYEEAIAERYRFYSYGDCMLIL